MHKLKLNILTVCMTTTLPMLANANQPSITAQAMGGDYASAWIDGLMPVYKNNQQLVYSDLQFEGSNTDAGILSVGGGYRQQMNSQSIAGAYLFYDRERSASESYYKVISPGVEYLTPSWQYRLNYYAPIGTKTYLITQGLASDFGNTQYESWSGNSKLDSMQYNYESLNYGADATIGYRFQADKRWQVNLSPYVFNQTDSNTMIGANAQLNFYTNDHTTIFLGDSYDNQNHNRVFVGVSFTLGGHNNDDTVDNLMSSPVYRNLDVNTTANGLPVDSYTKFSAPEQQPGFYAFVNDTATGSANLGTYEDPYTSIDEVSNAPSDAQIRVASTGTDYDSDGFTLAGTQTIGGYTDGYKLLATGNNRPIIRSDEGVVLDGDNTMAGLQVLSNGSSTATGITINDNATLDDMNVGSETSVESYQIGVKLSSGASATINDSTIAGYSSVNDALVYGIKAEANNTLTVSNSTISAVTDGGDGADAGTDGGFAYAVAELSNSIGNIENSTLSGSASASASYSYGLYLNAAGNIAVTNTLMSGSATNGSARGLSMLAEKGEVDVDSSTITAAGSTNARALTLYQNESASDVIVTDSTINATATGGSGVVTGVLNYQNTGNVTIIGSRSKINATTTGASAYTQAILSESSSGSVTITDVAINVQAQSHNYAYGVVVDSNTEIGRAHV